LPIIAKKRIKPKMSDTKTYLIVFLGISTVGLLIATIALAVSGGDSDEVSKLMSNVPSNNKLESGTIFDDMPNICDGKDPGLPNLDCIHVPGPQSGANVTKGFVGAMETDSVPITVPFWNNSMCPVNVHWHLGTEHYSIGEYDENGDGPHGNIPAPEFVRRLADEVRPGFRCHHYDSSDDKFVKEYEWKHCHDMEVGETYEVHWPQSAAGACGTVNQYQTPFIDGVFCKDGVLVDVPNQVGVQAQVFTIVNDENYFYPDMMRGWIVDGVYGQDLSYYTGSTTGTSRSNVLCSQYSPITWQVDRKCHMISASSFDKLCYDMKMQRDDMSGDMHPHGARELVPAAMVANNQVRHLHEDHDHDHSHADGDHDHSHNHYLRD